MKQNEATKTMAKNKSSTQVNKIHGRDLLRFLKKKKKTTLHFLMPIVSCRKLLKEDES